MNRGESHNIGAAARLPAYVLRKPVVLAGLMGAGKTSVGRRLAQALGVAFWDSDQEIELAAGMRISELFERYGEPSFRDGERRVVVRLLAQGPGVLATGGGAFMDAGLRAAIARAAVSVWLRADLDTLWDRVKDRGTRPLLQTPEPKAVLARLMAERYPVYATADLTVESPQGISHDAMVGRIVAALLAFGPEADPVLRQQAA